MKEFIRKCIDCGSEKKSNQKNASKRCASCAAKKESKNMETTKAFLLIAKKDFVLAKIIHSMAENTQKNQD